MGKARVTKKELSPLEQAVTDSLLLKVSHALSEKLAPHVVNVAKARCPVGDSAHEPRATSFRPVKLISKLPAGSSPDTTRRFQRLRAGTAEPSPGDAQFYRFRDRGVSGTPTTLAFRKGGVAGASVHQPGTLRDSIKFDGVKREGNRLIATITAHAEYAAAVNDGFTHRGGRKHDGTSSQIAGAHFMESALNNVRSRLTDKSTYEG